MWRARCPPSVASVPAVSSVCEIRKKKRKRRQVARTPKAKATAIPKSSGQPRGSRGSARRNAAGRCWDAADRTSRADAASRRSNTVCAGPTSSVRNSSAKRFRVASSCAKGKIFFQISGDRAMFPSAAALSNPSAAQEPTTAFDQPWEAAAGRTNCVQSGIRQGHSQAAFARTIARTSSRVISGHARYSAWSSRRVLRPGTKYRSAKSSPPVKIKCRRLCDSSKCRTFVASSTRASGCPWSKRLIKQQQAVSTPGDVPGPRQNRGCR